MSAEYGRSHRRARVIALACALLVAGMVGLSYAAVPLYRLFCQVTGFGGTTQVAEAAPGEAGERLLTIRFDANTAADLAWDFRPVERSIAVHVGEGALAYYRATNLSGEPTTGTATFNVTPVAAGQYFAKVECFCFTEQPLAPGQSADLPVSFFIDPAIDDDPDLAGVSTITLSYTYFSAAPGAGEAPLDATARTGQSGIN